MLETQCSIQLYCRVVIINVISFLCIEHSVRSKVRGMLEIYHAYIRDLDAAPEPDWEIVDTNETNVSC